MLFFHTTSIIRIKSQEATNTYSKRELVTKTKLCIASHFVLHLSDNCIFIITLFGLTELYCSLLTFAKLLGRFSDAYSIVTFNVAGSSPHYL